MIMPEPPPLRVWSEQRDPFSPGGRWVDCMHRTYEMGLVFAGLPAALFRLGIYTPLEGERFEDADGLPEYRPGAPAATVQETGLITYDPADLASRALFGVTGHPYASSDLPALLEQVGIGIAVTGAGLGLPAGPCGPHSVLIVPAVPGTAWVYDPRRQTGDRPESCPTSTILAWHRRNAVNPRVFRAGEFKDVTPKETNSMNLQGVSPIFTCSVLPGGAMYADEECHVAIAGNNPGFPVVGFLAGPVKRVGDGHLIAAIQRPDGSPAWVGAERIVRPASGAGFALTITGTVGGPVSAAWK